MLVKREERHKKDKDEGKGSERIKETFLMDIRKETHNFRERLRYKKND